MEVLSRRLYNSQCELEDALRMEITRAEVKQTKEGKKLFGWLRKRRRVILRILDALERI